jgi:peptide chain release factor subunit 1
LQAQSQDSVSRFRLKRTLDQLASKEGRGTELITLYIPPDRQIHEVIGQLREEYGTASNIKSRTTRKNVLDAIEKTIQRLKLFKRPPPNGLAIFCGAIPQNGPGTERMETYVLEPPEPIRVYLYRCDNRFHIEPLLEILREKDTFGIILIDGNDALIATLRGRQVNIVKEMTSGIPGKHRAGGQSARRFERLREAEVNQYYKRVGGHANEIFSQLQDLRGIIIGGPGPSKFDFEDGDYLNYELKKKIVATVDTTYVGDNGIDEVLEKAPEILRGVRYSEEKRLVQRFLYEVGHDTGLAAYGESEVRRALQAGLVNILLLSEKLEMIHATVKCRVCGYSEDRLLDPYEATRLEQEISLTQCKKCNNATLEIEKRDLLDELAEIGENKGVDVEIISAETEEGQQLLKGFGGIAAILRYAKTSPA